MTLDYLKYPVMIVDDEEHNLEAFDLNFGDDFTLLTARGGDKALKLLQGNDVAVFVVDQRMPGMTGMEFLAGAREHSPHSIAMLLTAYRDLEVTVEALNSGLVYRYVQKPWDYREMSVILRQLVELFAVQEENRRLVRRMAELNRYLEREVAGQYNHGEIIGESAPLVQLMETISKVAPTRSTILISGESGTGKELAARAIHNTSPRAQGPFVRVNLAALSPTIIESELFGHEKGSFTGAVRQKFGRFELAHNGTLFLDEIGDLPPEIQIKLLRVIQEREFERVGGAETVQVDVRLIAATNQNLTELVAAGTFREDLYYRVNVFPIEVPPLRERKEDIPLLAAHFAASFAPGTGKETRDVASSALEVLLGYDWPGNVRELENAVERAMILAEGHEITAQDFSFLVPAGTPRSEKQAEGKLPQLLDNIERRQLQEAMEKHHGSVSRVARELGLNRTTVYYRLKKHGLIK